MKAQRYGFTEGDPKLAIVNPTVIRLTKVALVHEKETATGENYHYLYQLVLDIADGATVTNIDVSDIISRNLHFVGVTDSDGGSVTLPTEPLRKLIIHFDSVTGHLGNDRTMRYEVYSPQYLEGITPLTPVLPPDTGSPTDTINEAIVSGLYNSMTVGSGPVHDTVELNSLVIQKSVDKSISKPLETLTYNLNFQVSDYFAIKDVIVTDTLGDGQTPLTSFIPHLRVTSGYNTIDRNFDTSNYYISPTPNLDGTWTIIFYLSRELMRLPALDPDGVLYGGKYGARDYDVPTTGTITFQSIIDTQWRNTASHPAGNNYLKSGDVTLNNVSINGKLYNNNREVQETSGSQVSIEKPEIFKSIYAINGRTDFDHDNPKLAPGDTVTFSIVSTVPTTNLGSLVLVDYLPIPFLLASEVISQYLGPLDIPPAGNWMLASAGTPPADTLSADILNHYPLRYEPHVSTDPVENSIMFDYGSFNNPDQNPTVLHLLFTVTAQNQPMDPNLYLTNLVQMIYKNSVETMYPLDGVAFLQTKEPKLEITKTANPIIGDAGDPITYTITVKNVGNWKAYNVNVRDVLPAELILPSVIQIIDNAGHTLIEGVDYFGNLFGSGITLINPLGI